jgi:heterodisulfide reductase subunit B
MLGYDPFKDCGLNAKAVAIEPLLDMIGIPYDKTKTFEERRRPF